MTTHKSGTVPPGARGNAGTRALLKGVALLAWCGTLGVCEWAGAGGPFSTGATAAQSNLLTILTPIAVIAVMALGVAAWFNKISWGWCVAGVVGIVLVFGAPQIVAWVRGMFGV